MFRSAIFALSLTASAAAAQDLDISDMINSQGLAATEASLTTGDPAAQFALGAVRFLRGIENTLQLRYQHNATMDDLDFPVLRLPVPPNPNADPFYPGLITDLFRNLETDMELAREALAQANGDFGVTVDLAKIWFDIDGDGVKDAGEDFLATASAALRGTDPSSASMIVRFDTADAAWLRAYTHLLSGISNLVMAFDPTEVIGEVLASQQAIVALRGDPSPRALIMSRDDEQFADMFAMFYGAVNQQPKAEFTRATRQHWLAMIEENESFWKLVAQETDNSAEWIPNATQTSAFGIQLPPEAGANWLNVLRDAKAVLNGELLVGHWRTSPGAGVNVAKLMEDPVPVDIVTWFQGQALVPFMERGTLVDTRNLRQFERMFGGDAILFMVWFN